MNERKPRTLEALCLALAVLITAVLNVPFWRLLYRAVEPKTVFEWLFIAAVFAAVLLVSYLVLRLVAVRPLFRPLIIVLLPLTAAASYFMLEYGVVIDVNMVRNVFETNSAEARDLISGKMLLYIALLGALPAALLWRVPISWPAFRDDVKSRLKAAAICVPLTAAVLFPFTSNVTSVFREHRELRMTLTPANFLSALNKYVRSKSLALRPEVKPYGEDAARAGLTGGSGRRTLFVIAVGETARSDHFSLNGYGRLTNPGLSKVADLVNFPQAFSCGTDTAQSVPCMFSGLATNDFSNDKAAQRENVLDILKRTGVDVIWRENQAGCKGVCERVTTETLTGTPHPAYNMNGETHDEILLDGLPERLKALSKDTVIVMHMMGSHGPAYWKRYPEAFEVFKPVCRESQFSRCTSEEIINAYDNTILYSDHVLAQLISILDAAAAAGNVDTGMIYMSDHGESLGENNMYLHGMPYAIAPVAQKHIPMTLWLSKNLRDNATIEQGCLTQNSAQPVGHDNLFHSVLGIMGVRTSVYDRALDLFASCRKATALKDAPPPAGTHLQ